MVELSSVERRARRAFEREALGRAVLGALPVVAAGGVAVLLARERGTTLLLALGLVAVAVAAFWARRGLQTAVAAGFFAGLVPYCAALVASQLGGHVCTPSGCVSWCLPACVVGGGVAGLVVSRVGLRRRAGLSFWIIAGVTTVATGALGCSCAGLAGASGLAPGFLVALLSSAAIRRQGRHGRGPRA